MNIIFSEFWNKKSSPTPTKGVKDLAEGPTCSVSISSGCFLSSLFMKILIKTISKYFIKSLMVVLNLKDLHHLFVFTVVIMRMIFEKNF